ncbi:MAG: phosphopantothenoylcysteine decarboxylase [Planctomycetota bacterium]
MRVLVTAGPTREPLDPVRFLSNRSSGRMGFAVARALRDRGHEVVLVCGPTALEPPSGVECVRIGTATEMLAACREHWPRCQALFAVAAVADWRPARVGARKLKRGAGGACTLELVPNPDILATLAREKGARLAVGFALESGDGREEARRKLREKNLDFLALNGPEAQEAAVSRLWLLDARGGERELGPAPKEELARGLLEAVLPAGDEACPQKKV